MRKLYNVIIADAVPIGLFLASEPTQVQVSVLVFEREPTTVSLWKVKGLGQRAIKTSSIEIFYWRDLPSHFFNPGEQPRPSKRHLASNSVGCVDGAEPMELVRREYSGESRVY
jgi:hypothetical protein